MQKPFAFLFSFALFGGAAVIGCDNPDAAQSEPAANETAGDEAAQSADTSATEVTLVNAICPLMGGKAKSTVTTDWNGQTVGFCCPECIPEWEKLSDDEKTAKLTAAAEEAAGDEQKNAT